MTCSLQLVAFKLINIQVYRGGVLVLKSSVKTALFTGCED